MTTLRNMTRLALPDFIILAPRFLNKRFILIVEICIEHTHAESLHLTTREHRLPLADGFKSLEHWAV